MKPNTYKKQNGCHNCKYVFKKPEYTEEVQFFCNLDGSKRPLCGSIYMEEPWHKRDDGLPTTDEEWESFIRKWDEWSKPREVSAWGICDEWNEKK